MPRPRRDRQGVTEEQHTSTVWFARNRDLNPSEELASLRAAIALICDLASQAVSADLEPADTFIARMKRNSFTPPVPPVAKRADARTHLYGAAASNSLGKPLPPPHT